MTSTENAKKSEVSRRTFVQSTAALSAFSVIPQGMLGADDNDRPSATDRTIVDVKPESLPVDTVADLSISIRLGRALTVGDTVALALPESWSCEHYCFWATRQYQLGVDVLFSAGNTTFKLTQERIRHEDHQRKILATISNGTIEAGQFLTIKLPKVRSAWIAENALCRLWINDEELTPAPALVTEAKEHVVYRVFAPATVKPGEPFQVKIVSLDEFWNPSTSQCHGRLQIEDGDVIDELTFTGYVDVTTSLKQQGVYRFQFEDVWSNAVVVSDTDDRILFGDLHTHDKTHNCGSGEDAYGYARDVSGLDFAALAPAGMTDKEAWELHVKKTEAAYDPLHFTTFAAFEHQRIFGSHHNVIYRDGLTAAFEYDQERVSQMCRQGKAFLIPHHPGVNWGYHKGHDERRDDIIPLMEVYSVHGQGEYYCPEHILSYEFNRVRNRHNWASSIDKPIFYRDALAKGRRYGVVASCDDHGCQPGKPINGVAAVIASKNTREEIWRQLKQRHTYGTTGERIVLKFSVNGALMGSEISLDGPQQVKASADVYGTGSLAFVEIVKYGFPSHKWSRVFFREMKHQAGFGRFNPKLDRDFASDDIVLDADEPCLFYLRVMQRTQYHNWPAFAWSSPVWVDLS